MLSKRSGCFVIFLYPIRNESLLSKNPRKSNSSGNDVLKTAYTKIAGIATTPSPAKSDVAVSISFTV